MKTSLTFACLLAASLATAAPARHTATATATATASSTPPSHYLHTLTDNLGYTLLIDDANHDLGGFIAGITGVDGIYGAKDIEPMSGTDTWVDIHNGEYAVIDYEHPRFYTVYDSDGSPIKTVSHSYTAPTPGNSYSTAPSHYLMTFVNQDSQTLLIDQAVTNAAILEVGVEGIDGIYTIPAGGFPVGKETGTDTWVDSVDGIVAIIDNSNPNLYTVYDASSNPIETVNVTPTPTTPLHNLQTFTNAKHETVEIDYNVAGIAAYVIGSDGVDGFYTGIPVPHKGHSTGLDTWINVNDGEHVIIDYAHPYTYTGYDSNSNPIETGTFPLPSPAPTRSGYHTTEPTHQLRTFTNQNSRTVVVDYALPGVALLEDGVNGVDGFYYASNAQPHSGTDTWVNDLDGVVAIIDNANPNYYTVYNSAGSAIETVSY
ncbi:hypothetical protein FBU31_000618 [Coemansia sp. 'formosensis']|nr:hypothetical protein FBU31_000618 [Coemansia sp. 'formosensis']